MRRFLFLAIIAIAAALSSPAQSQAPVVVYCINPSATTGLNANLPCSSTNPLYVTGTVTATAGATATAAAPSYTEGTSNPLSQTLTGNLRVTGVGGTFPATQSGTWTVQPGNTANTTAWLVGLNSTASIANGNGVIVAPSSASSAGITVVVSASAEATHVLKASAGNLYSVYATNLTATAGFLHIYNATSAPADGAVTPLACVPLPSNGATSINFNPGPPSVYSTGISVAVSSASTCFTKTTGVITAFISGSVQ